MLHCYCHYDTRFSKREGVDHKNEEQTWAIPEGKDVADESALSKMTTCLIWSVLCVPVHLFEYA